MSRENFGKKKQSFSSFQKVEKVTFSEINSTIIGDMVSVQGVVNSIAQTSGPTLFSVSDGTGSLMLKGFIGPGERAYPEIEVGDVINAAIKINEFNGTLEGEMKKVSKLLGEAESKVREFIEETERKRATPEIPDFLVNSPILEKLKDRFVKAATEIRLAIVKNRPIIVRHHNDTDGYSSGFALERAIIPLIEQQHGPGKAAWEYYTRAPCAAPFYEIEDSIKDTAHSLSDVAKFSSKMPLVIIADNGSSKEDLMGIKQGKIHGMDFIIVDHHYFEEDVISKEVMVHINPFLVGEDGAKFSAGMLCVEFARFINSKVENLEQVPAMAGLADRIDNPSVMNAYLEIAGKHGYTKGLLDDISTVVDFVSAKLRFMEAREYIEVLFGEPRDQQKSLVALMAPHIRKMESKGLEVAKSAVSLEKLGSVNLQLLPIEQVFPRGFYPKPGKCTGLVHDYQKAKTPALVTIGVMSDAMTIRATDEANFSVHELIETLHKKLPAAFADGGGHKNAGSITFLPNKQAEVLKLTKDYIKSKSS